MSKAPQQTTVVSTFTCKVCGGTGTNGFSTTQPPGATTPLPGLPEGWIQSYGASGRGQFYQCPKCVLVLIDDSGRGVVLDYSYRKDLVKKQEARIAARKKDK